MKAKGFLALLLAAALSLPTACAAEGNKTVTDIALSDSAITVAGKAASDDPQAAVYVGADIIYYEDKDTYPDGSTYGQGTAGDKHTAAEAAAHTVLTITQPGTYRLSGALSHGQIAVDLGQDAKDDPEAVVTLILDNVNVTCTVAPALIFYNVYECDRVFADNTSANYQASAQMDTAQAGANVIIAAGTENTFTGSHVARIYQEGTTKKLHKYDGAFYSRMSMNVDGDSGDDSGVLNIIADNEGLDSELHLTVNGGTINIQSQDDGINTNEDFVSVTTINGGVLTVNAGLGSEGDGIDSNGYLVINGGTIWTMSNERSADGGIDADSPILINGGTLSAFGTRNDAASNDSTQPYMELSFASTLSVGSVIELKDEADAVVWSATTRKACQSVTLTDPALKLDTTYHLYVDGVLQCWSGNGMGGGFGGGMRGQRPESPEGFDPSQFGGQHPDRGDFDPSQFDGQQPPQMPADDQRPGRGNRPGGNDGRDFDPSQFDGQRPDDGHGFGGFGQTGAQPDGSGSTDFVLTATTKTFSGVCDSDASGKTRVSFAVDGITRQGRDNVLGTITAITPSAEIDPALVQITVTDDPSENYAATCKLSDGLEAVNALLPTEDGDYILTVAVASGSEGYTGATQISFTVGALPFADVAQSDPGYAAIKILCAAGVMTGTGEGRFSPNMTVTRAQAVTVLARLAGAAQAETDTFSDVDTGSWYSGYVGWAVDNGIVQGDGQGHFFPDMAVTAQHLALMLERYRPDYTDTTGITGELTRSQLAQMVADVL